MKSQCVWALGCLRRLWALVVWYSGTNLWWWVCDSIDAYRCYWARRLHVVVWIFVLSYPRCTMDIARLHNIREFRGTSAVSLTKLGLNFFSVIIIICAQQNTCPSDTGGMVSWWGFVRIPHFGFFVPFFIYTFALLLLNMMVSFNCCYSAALFWV